MKLEEIGWKKSESTEVETEFVARITNVHRGLCKAITKAGTRVGQFCLYLGHAQKRLLKITGPQWVAMFGEQRIDAALLVPV